MLVLENKVFLEKVRAKRGEEKVATQKINPPGLLTHILNKETCRRIYKTIQVRHIFAIRDPIVNTRSFLRA